MRGVAVPVLEGALDRSLQLATSMDARGYGRRNEAATATRRLAIGATAAGLLLLAFGIYGVIDAGSLFGLGLPLVAVAVVLCGVGLAAGGRHRQRTRYRPDRWGFPEWIIVGSGVAAVGTMALSHALGMSGVTVSFVPLSIPPLPLLPVAGILVATLPAFVAPDRRPAEESVRSQLDPVVA
jgi:energy-coupling factor transport system permease protein